MSPRSATECHELVRAQSRRVRSLSAFLSPLQETTSLDNLEIARESKQSRSMEQTLGYDGGLESLDSRE